MKATTHKKSTIDFKLKVIELIHLNLSYHYISKRLGIDRKVLRDCVK
jgi:hypothetical protein